MGVWVELYLMSPKMSRSGNMMGLVYYGPRLICLVVVLGPHAVVPKKKQIVRE